ncbi:MAG: osmoprotectant transport system permease protein [Myxococcota bacterium]|jgi:osmoprotectant transport system permease protein
MSRLLLLIPVVLVLGTGPRAQAADGDLVVASKLFTESVILGDMLAQLTGAEHRKNLGATQICWKAMLRGDVHAYVDYTGTLIRETLAAEKLADLKAVRAHIKPMGLGVSKPIGFNNTYAMGMKEGLAERLGIRKVSDLKDHPDLVFRLGEEFMQRADGWPGLRKRYGLPQTDVKGMDHDLAYRGLESGDADVIDVYSTDAAVEFYSLRVLTDDLHFFPRYDAVVVYRLETEQKAWHALEGLIDSDEMTAMNARAKLDKVPEAQVAADFLNRKLDLGIVAHVETRRQRIQTRTWQHLELVALSLGVAILLAIPLGLLAVRSPRLAPVILGAVGVLQTVPSLALLVILIPVLGLGKPPAVMALLLYSLLPIVRNTYQGVHDIAPDLLESADALGLSPSGRLRLVELPLASRAILAGIKTAAVINVGTATLAAIIGAGGYGQPILRGIRLDRMDLILEGAIPAAILALLVQGAFDLSERIFVPRGLRLKS